jgi:hypothetical protein
MNAREMAVVVILGLSGVACGGSEANVPGPKGDASTTATNPTDPDGGAPTAPPAPPLAPPKEAGAGPMCSAEATLTGCQSCCYSAHSSGTVYLVEQMAACECGAKGPCQAACADTLCATPLKAADAACQTCVQGNLTGACSSVLTACSGVPDCSDVLLCLESCVGKP